MLLACAVVLALGAAISLASAASLSLDGGLLTSVVASHPCPGQATATAASGSGTTYSAVSITAPTGCSGRPLTLTVLNGATVLRTGTATVAASGATTVTFIGTYTASSSLTVRAVVDGWNLPTTWSFTPPTPLVSCEAINNPALTCSAALTHITSWGWPTLTNFNATITVSGPSTTVNTEWQITINLADPAFPFVPVAMGHNNASELATGWSCAQMPLLVLNGQTSSSTDLVGGSKTVSVYFEGRTTGSGNLATCTP